MPPSRSGPARVLTTARTDTPFQVVYADPLKREKSGRAKRIVKWFADLTAANAHRDETNRTLLTDGTAGVGFDHDVRADAIGARRVLDAAGHTGVSLIALAEAYSQKVKHHSANTEQIGVAVAAFLIEKEHAEGRSPETVRNLRTRLWRWINRAGIATIGDLTREKIEPLRTGSSRAGKLLEAQTRRNDLAAVSAFCSHLLDRRKIDHHPLKGLRRPHVPWKPPAIFTTEECGRLLGAARAMEYDDVLGTVAVMLFAGLRPSELEHTRIFYGARPVVRVEGGKLRGRANRIVALGPAAVAWLKAAGSPARVGEMTKHARNRLMAAAGLTWKVDILRHTCISNRAEIVNNDGQLAKDAGTSEAMIARHYRRLVTRKEAMAWAALRPG